MTTEKPVIEPPETSAPSRARTAPAAWKKPVAIWGRWLHVYLSMVSFAILLFFAVTGLTLNHADWFSGKEKTVRYTGQVQVPWVKGAVAKLEVVEFLRRAHGIKGAVSDFRIDDQQCEVSFKGPGYTADAFIERATGKYDLTENRMGIVAVMNDLHKGRDSGTAWSAVLDISAVLMTLVSLTGLILIFFLPKRRASGLVIAFAGLVVVVAAYLIWVP